MCSDSVKHEIYKININGQDLIKRFVSKIAHPPQLVPTGETRVASGMNVWEKDDTAADLRRSRTYILVRRRLNRSFAMSIGLVLMLVLFAGGYAHHHNEKGLILSKQVIENRNQIEMIEKMLIETNQLYVAKREDGSTGIEADRLASYGEQLTDGFARVTDQNHPSGFGGLQSDELVRAFHDPTHGYGESLRDLKGNIARLSENPNDLGVFHDLNKSLSLAHERLTNAHGELISNSMAYRETSSTWQQNILLLIVLLLIAELVFVFRPLANSHATKTAEIAQSRFKLERLMRRDQITGLGNRLYLTERLEKDLNGALSAGELVGLFHIEIGNLGVINAQLGLGASDTVVTHYSRIIPAILRDHDTLARVGETEFVIVVRMNKANHLSALADRLYNRLTETVDINGDMVRGQISIGYMLVSTDTKDQKPEILLTSAKLAMLKARSQGGAPVIFAPSLRQQYEDEAERRRELERAFANDEITAWFQPQVSLSTGRVIGFEALARWEHPSLGTLTPDRFIPLIERENLNSALTRVVLHSALDALVQWRRAGHVISSVGVNFAARDLRDRQIVDQIKWALDSRDLEPGALSVELLETLLVKSDNDPAARNITRLHEAGYGIDLDDFGTGHASIQSVLRFPISRIKIDRGFIGGINSDISLQRMASVMITMARDLNIAVLAEGVETDAEEAMLVELGCDAGQGYGIARPMPLADTLTWLEARKQSSKIISAGAA